MFCIRFWKFWNSSFNQLDNQRKQWYNASITWNLAGFEVIQDSNSTGFFSSTVRLWWFSKFRDFVTNSRWFQFEFWHWLMVNLTSLYALGKNLLLSSANQTFETINEGQPLHQHNRPWTKFLFKLSRESI